MVNCPICQREFKDGRALHAHMLKAHLDEYRARGCKLAAFGVDAAFSGTRKKAGGGPVPEKTPDPRDTRPAGFRLLNQKDEAERAARAAGYTFVDRDENIYTLNDAKSRGWA